MFGDRDAVVLIVVRYDNNDLKFHSTTGAFSPQQFFEYLQGAFDTLLAEGRAGQPKMVSSRNLSCGHGASH